MQDQKIILTESQEIGVKKIEKFLKSDNKYFVLVGPAGSGKTTMIKHALEAYLNKPITNGIPNVIGICLSHKAKNVLSASSIPYTRTFASAYGFKEVIHNDGSRTFEPNKYPSEPPVGHLDIPIFVHDEISQYSESMKRIVFEKTSLFSKVIMMGDKAQLPPIDAKMKVDADSPIFEMELPESCKHTLTERIRQKKGNPILDLSDMIREEIFGSQNLNRIIAEILKPKLFDGTGYLILEKAKLYDKYVEQENYLMNKIISFRNFAVENTNTKIRDILFPGVHDKLVENDLVFMTNNFVGRTPQYYKMNNSDEYIIKEVGTQKIDVPHSPRIECCFGQIFTSYQQNGFIITPTNEGLVTYNKILGQLTSDAQKDRSLWKKKYEFTDFFCDYTMGYAINAYRCQGSTYENAFVDLMDILETGPLTPKRKLQTIYTAITRAKKIVYFIKP